MWAAPPSGSLRSGGGEHHAALAAPGAGTPLLCILVPALPDPVTMLARSVAASAQGSAGAGAQQPVPRPARALKALPKGLGAAASLLAARPALAAAEPFGADGIGGSGLELPSLPALPAVELPAVDVSALGLDAIDPLYVAAGAALVAIPLGLVALLGGGSTPRAKAVPAATAVEALAADPGCLLVDIRSKAEAAEVGSPSLKGVSKRAPAAVPFTATSKEVGGGQWRESGEFIFAFVPAV